MKTFKVSRTYIGYETTIVEAKDEDKALELAEKNPINYIWELERGDDTNYEIEAE